MVNFAFMVLLNYAVRVLTILVGLFFLSGRLFYEHPYKTELQVIGAMLVVWGVYRIFSYRKALKEYKNEDDND
ncbi:hypothetical protein D9V87_04965 [Bacteroidetes/Chlorobi group bacterium MS-B_bin-24]|jgi:hypothetical protein|nr:MAG: hypothetical protein D9V87_04965 [Bacteroidetes/Chlorobi group bacterium MS-B_bin-24]